MARGPLRGSMPKGSTSRGGGASRFQGKNWYLRDDIDSIAAHEKGVKAAVHAEGRERQGRIRARLAEHRETGAAKIEGRREDTDYLIELVDPAALSIEYGRAGYERSDGAKVGPMEGLRILGREL